MGIDSALIYPENGCLRITIHSYAFIHSKQTVASTAFWRSQTRDSSTIQVRFNDEVSVGVVRFYCAVSYYDPETMEEPSNDVQLAFCRFYDHVVEVGSEGMGKLLCCPKVQLEANSKTRDQLKFSFKYGEGGLEVCDTFNYLGTTLHANKEMKEAGSDRIKKARKTLHSFRKMTCSNGIRKFHGWWNLKILFVWGGQQVWEQGWCPNLAPSCSEEPTL